MDNTATRPVQSAASPNSPARHNIIGCMINEFANPFYATVIRAVEEYADLNGYFVFNAETRRSVEIEKRYLERICQLPLDGLIIRPQMRETDHLHALKQQGIPAVLLSRTLEGFDSVNLDNLRSGEIAGEYLAGLGHRSIAFAFSGNEDNIPELERLNGLWHALRGADLLLERIYRVGKSDFQAGELAAEEWLADEYRPSAVFCSSDLLAMGFIHAAIRRGVRVPRDVSVLGHDDILFADLFEVSLTTVSYPKYALGHIATRLLIERINGKRTDGEIQNVRLEPEIIVRSSCAPHPQI